MYDFYDDAGHHHRSQCKHWTAFKGRTQAWLGHFLGTSGHFLGTSGTSLFGYIFGIFMQKLWETLLFWT